jgi:hypothetical protein
MELKQVERLLDQFVKTKEQETVMGRRDKSKGEMRSDCLMDFIAEVRRMKGE